MRKKKFSIGMMFNIISEKEIDEPEIIKNKDAGKIKDTAASDAEKKGMLKEDLKEEEKLKKEKEDAANRAVDMVENISRGTIEALEAGKE